MPFIGQTSLNNMQVDGVYVNVLSPTPNAGIGVPTNLGGIVGSGSWGPLNTPVAFSDIGSLYNAFGKQTLATYNLATEAQFAVQFANNFLGIRVTDGTDAAASIAIASGMTLTGKYTGTVGNTIQYAIASGSNSISGALTFTLTISAPGYTTEVYRNIVGGSTGTSFWANAVSAINNGTNALRPASNLVTATLNGGTSTSVISNGTLSGGLSGESSVTAAQALGTDGAIGSRTGIYALRGTGVDTVMIAGDTNSANWGPLATFASQEACLALCCIPSGTSVANSVSSKNTAGLASVYAAIAKDFVYWQDAVNNQKRLTSPMGNILGHILSLAPEQSPGNKPKNGFGTILGTEQLNNPYSYSDASTLQAAGILYIANPIPRGPIFGLPHGENSSMVLGQDNIAYTRMTNYLAKSIGGLLGQFVDELQGSQPNDPTRLVAGGVLNGFLQQLKTQNRISGFGVQMDLKNNTPTTIGEGLLIALIQVAYMAVIKYFVAQLQGGQLQVVTASSIS